MDKLAYIKGFVKRSIELKRAQMQAPFAPVPDTYQAGQPNVAPLFRKVPGVTEVETMPNMEQGKAPKPPQPEISTNRKKNA